MKAWIISLLMCLSIQAFAGGIGSAPKQWPFATKGVTVSPDGKANYLTIQDAINSGATSILVGPGIYTEKLSMSSGTRTIMAAGAAFLTTNGGPHSVLLNPALAAGEAAVTVSGSARLNLIGFQIEPSTGAAGAQSAVRFSGDRLMMLDCQVVLQDTGSTVGPNYALEATGVYAWIGRSQFAGIIPSGAVVRRAIFVGGFTIIQFHDVTTNLGIGGTAEGELEANTGGYVAIYNSTIIGKLTNTASVRFYVDATTRVTGTRTTPGNPLTLETGATPDGLIWFDTTRKKDRHRENGVSLDVSPVTVSSLAANATANATTTGVEITGLQQTLQIGRYAFKFILIGQSAATTTGVKFGVNFTGTTTSFRAIMLTDDVGTAGVVNGTVDGVNTGVQPMAAYSTRALSTTAPNLGPTLNVDTANADQLYIIEGIIIVSTAGDFELWHGSEVAASTQVMAGSACILTRLD